MRISDILDESMVLADAAGPDKSTLLHSVAEHIVTQHEIGVTADVIHEGLMNRERLGSTGVGGGVAIPHAKISGLKNLIGCFARASTGVEFDAIDKQPARLIFVLLVPENSAGTHLKALARISRLLKNEGFRRTLLGEPDRTSIYRAFVDQDEQH